MSFEDLAEDMADGFSPLAEELFEHFDREEQTLFPFILKCVPSFSSAVDGMIASHDRISGAMSRINRLLQTGALTEDNFDAFVALFARFDASFVKHSQQEASLLEALSAQLEPEGQTELQAMLDEF